MAELTVPMDVKFTEYKGFTLNVKNLDESFKEFIGLAVGMSADNNQKVQFLSRANSRNLAGRHLKSFIDTYRRTEKQAPMIITTESKPTKLII
jgi:hypothetical protein